MVIDSLNFLSTCTETFCAPTVLQRGIAESISLENGDIIEHMEEATVLMEKNSRLLCDALEQSLGLTVFRPQVGVYTIINTTRSKRIGFMKRRQD